METNHCTDFFRQFFHAVAEQLGLQLVVIVARDVLGLLRQIVLYLVEGDVVLVSLGQIDGAVLGDAAHPMTELGGVLEGVQPLPRAEKGILYGIFCRVDISRHGFGHEQGGLAVTDHQFLKGGLVPHEGQGD